MKVVSRWNLQHNKNNRGASLVTVLLTVSIVSAITMLVLAIAVLNMYMKKADLQGQSAFYDAESALEEIRTGLSYEASSAASYAYIDTLGKYSSLTDEEKTENFQNVYQKKLKEALVGDTINSWYDVTVLEGYLRDTKYDAETGVGAKVSYPENGNYVNVEAGTGVILKNVIVTYVDGDGYTSTIKTDICLKYPAIDFANASNDSNILYYGLIAGTAFEAKGATEFTLTGNAYLGDEGVTISNTTVNLKNNTSQEGSAISGGDITLSNNAALNVDGVQLWGDSLDITNSSYTITAGATYLKNDLLLEAKAKVTMAGRFILFGNPWVAQNAASLDAETVQNNMPEYSSAILVNGTGTTLDLSGLNTLVIGGSAYIRGSSYSDSSETPVVTGQSIAIKSDQRAYLIPADDIIEYYDDDGKAWGGENPMTGDSYLTWLKAAATTKATQWETEKEEGNLTEDEINAGNPYKDGDGNIKTSALSQSDLVDFVNQNQTIGALSDFGCTGFSVCAYPTTKGGTVVYLFMQFQDVDIKDGDGNLLLHIPAEANANLYYQAYNTYQNNKDRLTESLESYVSGGLTLPANINDTTKMYFTGDLIATGTDDGAIVINDSITRADFTEALETEYSNQSIYYQDAYSSLRKNLTMDYSKLTSTEKSQNIFNNLVEASKITGNKYYMSTTGEAAVVVKGNYTINSSQETYIRQSVTDENGDKHSDAALALVIATGDVTVSADFEGVIIAGGTIKIEGSSKSITANAYKAALAMCAATSDDAEDTAAQYIRNAGQYLVGGVGDTNQSSGKVSFNDYVTYQNWVKQ